MVKYSNLDKIQTFGEDISDLKEFDYLDAWLCPSPPSKTNIDLSGKKIYRKKFLPEINSILLEITPDMDNKDVVKAFKKCTEFLDKMDEYTPFQVRRKNKELYDIFKMRNSHIYGLFSKNNYCKKIHGLLKKKELSGPVWANWKPNKQLTMEQLTDFYNIIKKKNIAIKQMYNLYKEAKKYAYKNFPEDKNELSLLYLTKTYNCFDKLLPKSLKKIYGERGVKVPAHFPILPKEEQAFWSRIIQRLTIKF